MKPTSYVPRPPSTLFIKVIEQSSFDDLLLERVGGEIIPLCDNLGDAILSVTHKFGVVPSEVVMFRYCDQVVLSLTLSAGNFECRPTFMAKISKGLSRSICTRILRFLETHNSALG